MESQKICCFTGHRPQNLPFRFNEADERYVKLKAALKAETIDLIEHKHVTDFISGMALGIDTYAAEIVLSLKKQYPQVWLECAIPCETQAAKWMEKDRDRYYGILELCDKETLLQTHYTADCMQKRNEYMVDKSDFVIAVWDGTGSGTGNTVRYAKEKGKKVIILDPNEICGGTTK
ncbi:MAG: SLOG family protein [Eubacteriales bacterium]|nr:SLOG family protein [Eubacteriales bacterium]